MAKLIYEMMQSLDGYVADVDGELGVMPRPGAALFRHWVDRVGGLGGMLYGRTMYDVMRYWDDDRPEWEADEHDFAARWRAKPKWIASTSLRSAGPNATIVRDDLATFVRALKTRIADDIDVAGPDLAANLTDLGLIDEYRLYVRPFVLGRGKPYFARARPALRLVATETVGEDAVQVTLVPA